MLWQIFLNGVSVLKIFDREIKIGTNTNQYCNIKNAKDNGCYLRGDDDEKKEK